MERQNLGTQRGNGASNVNGNGNERSTVNAATERNGNQSTTQRNVERLGRTNANANELITITNERTNNEQQRM